MRFRLLTTVAAGALVFGAFASTASASTHRTPSAAGRSNHSAAAGRVSPFLHSLVNQNDNDNGVGIVSQNFTDDPSAGLDIYDSTGADDFKVPNGKTWTVRQVVVSGAYFNGPGLADSENVTFYADKHGKPGSKISRKTIVGTSDSVGNLVIKVNVTLPAGKYWLSVQVNMQFGVGGEWGWNTNNTQRGAKAQWQNPADGFASGCTKWGTAMTTCLASGEGADDAFALKGSSS